MKNIVSNIRSFAQILMRPPHLLAHINGSNQYPDVNGKVNFYSTPKGVLVVTEIWGLPHSNAVCKNRIFGFHIHSGESCTGTTEDPFADALTHYNTVGCSHPFHAGDLTPLFENHGYAFGVLLTDRFGICEIMKKTIIIHEMADDYTTQPSGSAGKKIACGVIMKNNVRKCK